MKSIQSDSISDLAKVSAILETRLYKINDIRNVMNDINKLEDYFNIRLKISQNLFDLDQEIRESIQTIKNSQLVVIELVTEKEFLTKKILSLEKKNSNNENFISELKVNNKQLINQINFQQEKIISQENSILNFQKKLIDCKLEDKLSEYNKAVKQSDYAYPNSNSNADANHINNEASKNAELCTKNGIKSINNSVNANNNIYSNIEENKQSPIIDKEKIILSINQKHENNKNSSIANLNIFNNIFDSISNNPNNKNSAEFSNKMFLNNSNNHKDNSNTEKKFNLISNCNSDYKNVNVDMTENINFNNIHDLNYNSNTSRIDYMSPNQNFNNNTNNYDFYSIYPEDNESSTARKDRMKANKDRDFNSKENEIQFFKDKDKKNFKNLISQRANSKQLINSLLDQNINMINSCISEANEAEMSLKKINSHKEENFNPEGNFISNSNNKPSQNKNENKLTINTSPYNMPRVSKIGINNLNNFHYEKRKIEQTGIISEETITRFYSINNIVIDSGHNINNEISKKSQNLSNVIEQTNINENLVEFYTNKGPDFLDCPVSYNNKQPISNVKNIINSDNINNMNEDNNNNNIKIEKKQEGNKTDRIIQIVMNIKSCPDSSAIIYQVFGDDILERLISPDADMELVDEVEQTLLEIQELKSNSDNKAEEANFEYIKDANPDHQDYKCENMKEYQEKYYNNKLNNDTKYSNNKYQNNYNSNKHRENYNTNNYQEISKNKNLKNNKKITNKEESTKYNSNINNNVNKNTNYNFNNRNTCTSYSNRLNNNNNNNNKNKNGVVNNKINDNRNLSKNINLNTHSQNMNQNINNNNAYELVDLTSNNSKSIIKSNHSRTNSKFTFDDLKDQEFHSSNFHNILRNYGGVKVKPKNFYANFKKTDYFDSSLQKGGISSLDYEERKRSKSRTRQNSSKDIKRIVSSEINKSAHKISPNSNLKNKDQF